MYFTLIIKLDTFKNIINGIKRFLFARINPNGEQKIGSSQKLLFLLIYYKKP